MKNAPEIEIKFCLRPGQRSALESRLGAPARVLEQRDRYFDVPGRVLRIRRENDEVLLTHKDRSTVSSDGIKSRHEVEYPLPVDFVPRLEALLGWLGHAPLIEVRKERHEYDLPGFVVCLDRVEGLDPPDFVEIESAGGDTEAMRKLRDDLGLAADQVERRSYAAMVAAARASAGSEPARPEQRSTRNRTRAT